MNQRAGRSGGIVNFNSVRFWATKIKGLTLVFAKQLSLGTEGQREGDPDGRLGKSHDEAIYDSV